MNKIVCVLGASLVTGCCMMVNARMAQTGHLIVSLKDRETDLPITNATIRVRVQTKQSVGGHSTPPSSFTTVGGIPNSNGVANVEFQFYYPDFEWWVRSPSHYCHRYRVGARNEWIGCIVEESDYLHVDTNTVQGLAMYNELVQLENNNDYLGLVAKFNPKSVTYTNNVIVRSASFFSKHNPRPMYTYGRMDGPRLSTANPSVVFTNGLEVSRYESVDFDMKECLLVSDNPNHDDLYDGPAGKIADFHIERFSVITSGVNTTYGWIDFAPGCGAYKRNTTGDESFPTTYEVDTNALFLTRIPFECSSISGKLVRVERLLEKDEYMVLRTRVMTNEFGAVTNCNYSKILGPMTVTGPRASFDKVKFEALIFNPTPNDPNLEYDLRNNLSTRGYGSWCP